MNTPKHGSVKDGIMYFLASKKCEEKRVYAIISVIKDNVDYPQMGDFVSCEDSQLKYWAETRKRYPLRNIIPIRYVIDE